VKGKLKSGFTKSIVAAFAILAFSCNKVSDRPPGILSHSRMVDVLQEIYITEEKVNRLTLTRDSAERVFDLLEGKVFEKTGVPDSVFRASLDYYFDHPKEMELIYTAVVDSLQLKEQRAPIRTR
jgi:hypothetical protein